MPTGLCRAARRRAGRRREPARRLRVPHGRGCARDRAERGAPGHAGRPCRLPPDVPGRHRDPPPRARGASAPAPGGRRRDGRGHRPRDPQPAGVDARVDPGPAGGAVAERRAGQLMDIVLRESDRLNETIRSFLAYARPQAAVPASVDLMRVLTDAATLLRNSPELKPGHRVVVDGPADGLVVEADENQIRQVVWNLATNGLRAMPAGGTLRLVARPRRGRRRTSVLRWSTRGSGSPPSNWTRSFSRFTARSARAPASGWPSSTGSSRTTGARCDRVGRGPRDRGHGAPARRPRCAGRARSSRLSGTKDPTRT